MNAEERGRRLKGIINVFPTLPQAGFVGSGMAMDALAGWVRTELDQLPELAALSTEMKHNAGVAELADVVFACVPVTIIYGLNMDLKKRISLCVLLGLGLV